MSETKSRGRNPAPTCPNGCKRGWRPQHMRRLYTQPFISKKRKLQKIGWICPQCHATIIENAAKKE